MLKAFEHKNIISPIEINAECDYPYMITLFGEKGDLYEYITANGRLTEQAARKYWTQVLSAIRFLHDQDIVHRDIKLQNVVVFGEDNVQLIDFGFAQSLNSDDGTSRSNLS